MSVVGIDLGNQSILIAYAGSGGVDVILNESSNRQTPSFVSIQGKQRFYGDAASSMARSNITNTFSLIKLLVGRKYDNEEVQRELKRSPFRTSRLPNGGIGVSVLYDDKETVIPVEHLLAMLLRRAKEIGAVAIGVNVADAVLAVPHWFTEPQRRAILIASEIAELNTVKVIDETTAIALSYGFFNSAKKLFSETDPVHFMFIDLGYTSYSVTIVDFIQENMRVRSTVTDRFLGGRDFDDKIVEYLVQVFKTKTGIDVSNNVKAILKLEAAAEKAKKSLSPAGVNESNVSVECLAEDRDLSCLLTRDQFEQSIADHINRLRGPINTALDESGLALKDISSVEIVGGSTRINLVKRTLGEILGLDPSAINYGLKTTMNSDEAVARGGALQAAMLSRHKKVKTFNIIDVLPYGIVALFEDHEASAQTGEAPMEEEGKELEDLPTVGVSTTLFTHGEVFPSKRKRLTFRNKSSSFTVRLAYDHTAADVIPREEERLIGSYTIKVPPELVKSGPKDIQVVFTLDRNQIIFPSAAALEELAAEMKDGEEKSAGKKFKKVPLEVIPAVFALSVDDIKHTIEREAQWSNEDRLIRETADKRNELESYIYNTRSKLEGSYGSTYATAKEKSELLEKLSKTEDWLYGDGFESTKTLYAEKLTSLQVIGNKIEKRQVEEAGRETAIEALKKQVELGRTFVSNRDKDLDHITEDERKKVREETEKAERWMYDVIEKQAKTPSNHDPVLTREILEKKRQELFNIVNPIMKKPRPKPAPAPAPAEGDKSTPPEEHKNPGDGPGPAEEKSGEPMDTEGV